MAQSKSNTSIEQREPSGTGRGLHLKRNGAHRWPSIISAECGAVRCAAVLLITSIFLPYWQMRLNAAVPGGLFVTVYIDHMTGDVAEIDGLNHYIGMAPLDKAAQIERSPAPSRWRCNRAHGDRRGADPQQMVRHSSPSPP
ncbi:MAG: hypothetical protein R2856_19150 [Caldilineaceae bacterium]